VSSERSGGDEQAKRKVDKGKAREVSARYLDPIPFFSQPREGTQGPYVAVLSPDHLRRSLLGSEFFIPPFGFRIRTVQTTATGPEPQQEHSLSALAVTRARTTIL
jgi:hypothetical protein